MARPDGQSSPCVSVIMNCLNGARFMREAIDSVFSQTFEDWEIIFWDNASKDQSSDIAQSYGDKLRYFRSNTTYGLGAARNMALEKAQGRYIAFLDVDDIWLPAKLERQVPLFDNPEVGIVFCNTYFFNERGHRRKFYNSSQPFTGRAFRNLLVTYNLSMETVVIRREALDRLDEWFDPRFSLIEEKDLFLRIAFDWEQAYVDETLSMWRVHDQSLTWNNKKLFPKETEIMMSKFADSITGFERNFASEIDEVHSQINFQYAMADWESGNGSSARTRMKPYIFNNRKYFLLFSLSFFPHLLYRKAMGLIRVLP